MRRKTVFSLLPYLLLMASAAALPGPVVINEIHYEPAEKTDRDEFVELYNAGEEPVDLSGWFFSEGIGYTFPPRTVIAPGAYLTIAEDPERATSRGVQAVLGPFTGRLENDGETLVLRNLRGGIEDRVDYAVGFPWPTAAAGDGGSLELIHPALDNDLGGSWRTSGMRNDPFRERRYLLGAAAEGWHYRRGISAASEPPDAWRRPGFVEDASWEVGQTSIGYGDDDDGTILDDMRGSYTSVYLRRGFTVESPADLLPFLTLRLYADDGAVVWINGVEVLRYNVLDGELPHDATARGSREAR